VCTRRPVWTDPRVASGLPWFCCRAAAALSTLRLHAPLLSRMFHARGAVGGGRVGDADGGADAVGSAEARVLLIAAEARLEVRAHACAHARARGCAWDCHACFAGTRGRAAVFGARAHIYPLFSQGIAPLIAALQNAARTANGAAESRRSSAATRDARIVGSAAPAPAAARVRLHFPDLTLDMAAADEAAQAAASPPGTPAAVAAAPSSAERGPCGGATGRAAPSVSPRRMSGGESGGDGERAAWRQERARLEAALSDALHRAEEAEQRTLAPPPPPPPPPPREGADPDAHAAQLAALHAAQRALERRMREKDGELDRFADRPACEYSECSVLRVLAVG
jgi:hypothetical protein